VRARARAGTCNFVCSNGLSCVNGVCTNTLVVGRRLRALPGGRPGPLALRALPGAEGLCGGAHARPAAARAAAQA